MNNDDRVQSGTGVEQYVEILPGSEGKWGYDDDTVHISVSEQSSNDYTDVSVSLTGELFGSETHLGGFKLTLDGPARRDLIDKLERVEDAE